MSKKRWFWGAVPGLGEAIFQADKIDTETMTSQAYRLTSIVNNSKTNELQIRRSAGYMIGVLADPVTIKLHAACVAPEEIAEAAGRVWSDIALPTAADLQKLKGGNA